MMKIRKIFIYVMLGAYVMMGGLTSPSSIVISEDQTGNVDSYILGDVDGDGEVTTDDAKLIFRASIGLDDLSINKAMFERADYDGDGKITSSDVRAALRASVELEPTVLVEAQNEPDDSEPDTGDDGLDAIPDSELGKVIDSIATPFGTIAIFSDDRVAICKNKSISLCWDKDTTENDILFDAHTFNPKTALRWYGVIGDDIYYFTRESMVDAITNISCYSYTGTEWYCFYLVGERLFAWSPSVVAPIASGVTDFAAYGGVAFFEEDYGYIYAMKADPYRIQHMSQEYINAHPIDSAVLGYESVYGYTRNVGSDSDEIDHEKLNAFLSVYDIDYTKWGYPKNSIDTDDLESFSWTEYDDIYSQFDIPSEKTSEMMKFDNVSFNGKKGQIYISFKNGTIDSARWTAKISSMSAYNELLAHLRTLGTDGEVRYPRQGQVEQGVNIGIITVYAGYDSNTNGNGTYILVEYQ